MRPDFRVRRVDGQWVVDGWTHRGWEELPGRWPTRRDAIASTDPASAFCYGHWSWLCGINHTAMTATQTPSALRIDAAAGGDGAPVGCLPPDPRPAAPERTQR